MGQGEERDRHSSAPVGALESTPRPIDSLLRADPALLRGRCGRWRWPWVLAGTVGATSGVLLLLRVADFLDTLVALPFGEPLESLEFVAGRPDTFTSFLTYAFALIIPVCVVFAAVHRISWRAALGSHGRFEWPMFWRAAGATFTLYAVAGLLTWVTEPENLAFRIKPASHSFWLALAVLVILPQAFAEELVFKGYLLRVWGALIPYRAIVATVLAAIFAWLHAGNDDVKADLWFNLISFFAVEVLTFVIYLRTASLGAMTGLHWMNNVISFCLITTVPGSANAFALVVYTDPVLSRGMSHLTDPQAWAELLVGLAGLWMLLTWRRSPFFLPRTGHSR